MMRELQGWLGIGTLHRFLQMCFLDPLGDWTFRSRTDVKLEYSLEVSGLTTL